MEVWLTLLAGGLVTFATRLSFIQLFEKFEIPSGLKRALRFVPPAVLAAIIFPELLLREGVLALETSNFRLLAGLVAERRDALAQQTGHLHERVFAWMTLSDERNLAGAYVAGVQRHSPGEAAQTPREVAA